MTSIVADNNNIDSSSDERHAARAAVDAAEEELRVWTVSHAATFVAVERRSRLVQTELERLRDTVDGALAKVERSTRVLQDEGDEEGHDVDDDNDDGNQVMKEGSTQPTLSLAELSERHRVRRRTLLQHSSLLELLELPNLMDACVRSNLYEEALHVAAFGNTLSRRHHIVLSNNNNTSSNNNNNSNKTVAMVVSQIRSRSEELRRHLLSRLRQNVTLPDCLEVVTAVRRLDAIALEQQESSSASPDVEGAHAQTELQLQVDFLEARDVWLDDTRSTAAGNSHTASSSNNNHSSRALLWQQHGAGEEPLLDAIERYRTRVFEVATQFNAIFRAQQSTAAASSSSMVDSAKRLLTLWTTRRVQSFLDLLERELPRAGVTAGRSTTNYAAALRDALEASVFLATSLGRLGVDFGAQLANVFEPRMLEYVTAHWSQGVAQLEETLTVCRDAKVADPLFVKDSDDGTSDPDGTTAADSSDSGGPQPPPKVLLTLPPLARLVNAFLTGLNELRRCLLPGILPALRRAATAQLDTVAAALQTNERLVLAPGQSPALRTAAAALQTSFRTLVIPYVQGSLEAAVGNEAGASIEHAKMQAALEALRPPAPEAEPDEPENGSAEETNAGENTPELVEEASHDDANAVDDTNDAREGEHPEIEPLNDEGVEDEANVGSDES